MKLSAFNDLICQTHNVFEECQQKFYDADKAWRECYTDYDHYTDCDRAAKQLVKDIHFHRQDTVFCALNSLILAKDILEKLGYIEED